MCISESHRCVILKPFGAEAAGWVTLCYCRFCIWYYYSCNLMEKQIILKLSAIVECLAQQH